MNAKLLFLLMILAFSSNVLAQNKVKTTFQVVEEFWENVLQNKINSNLPEFINKINQSDFEAIKKDQIKIVQFIDEVKTQDDSIIEVNVIDNKGNEFTYTFILLKNEAKNEWKIIDMYKKIGNSSPIKRMIRREPIIKPANLLIDCPNCS